MCCFNTLLLFAFGFYETDWRDCSGRLEDVLRVLQTEDQKVARRKVRKWTEPSKTAQSMRTVCLSIESYLYTPLLPSSVRPPSFPFVVSQ